MTWKYISISFLTRGYSGSIFFPLRVALILQKGLKNKQANSFKKIKVGK